MNTNEEQDESGESHSGLWAGVIRDRSVHQALAAGVVAIGIAIVKGLIFSKGR